VNERERDGREGGRREGGERGREGGERVEREEERDVPVAQPRETEMEKKAQMGIVEFQLD